MRRPVILLAEGDAALRQRLSLLLLDAGCEVIASPDLTTTLRALRQRRTLDLLMVNASLAVTGDGVDLARLVRRSDRQLPIMLLVTARSAHLAFAALRAGEADCITLPCSSADLLARVQRCLAAARRREHPDRPATHAGAAGLGSDTERTNGEAINGVCNPPVMDR